MTCSCPRSAAAQLQTSESFFRESVKKDPEGAGDHGPWRDCGLAEGVGREEASPRQDERSNS